MSGAIIISRDDALRDRLADALRRLNRNDDGSEWLDERRISQAISQLERPTSRDFIAINEELHDKIVRGVRAACKGLVPDLEDHLIAAGIKPTDRAETVGLEQFCALARSVKAAR